MDNFAEQLVKKSESSSDRTKRVVLLICGILMTLALAVTAFLQLGQPLMAILGFLLAVSGGVGTYVMFTNSFVEYEYTFTNGELDIDKIIAQRRRQEMLSTDVKKFTAFGQYNEDMEETDDMTVVIASDNIASHEYYADFQHEEYGSTRLIFAPDERMLENIVRSLPAKIRSSMQ